MSRAAASSGFNFCGRRANCRSVCAEKLGKIAPSGRGPKAFITCACKLATIPGDNGPCVALAFGDDSFDSIWCDVEVFIVCQDCVAWFQICQHKTFSYSCKDPRVSSNTFIDEYSPRGLTADLRRVRQNVHQPEIATERRLFVVEVVPKAGGQDHLRREHRAALDVDQPVGERLHVIAHRCQVDRLVVLEDVELEKLGYADAGRVVAQQAVAEV